MGCCSVTPITKGIDDVGPDEIELLEIDGVGQTLKKFRQFKQEAIKAPDPIPVKQCAQKRISQVLTERYLVLFSFHLLILALDNSTHEFIYEVGLAKPPSNILLLLLLSKFVPLFCTSHRGECVQGILPLSAIEVKVISQQDHCTLHMFEIIGPMVDSKIFKCASTAERKIWIENIEDRRCKSLRHQLSPSHSALSYLLPCDENWKREELKRYLQRSTILQWEGSPIQHMGQPAYLSLVHISNTQKQGSQERLFVLFPLDLLILSVDSQRLWVKYEGRLPRKSIRALEKSARHGRLEFELTGELMESLLVSCTYPEDYQNWIFQLQQPEKAQAFPNHTPPPLIPKKRRS
ncbi:hypothetical protein QTP70_014965 [Hemibagrus guttatus]|uniref:PH domain-containing protein n=1 Tax=Hemibagrus guttatus TaxID=175788 RepID=A0AAE0QEA7_9TELE|nr:hypothetical protein QTP70_014965 [Hemibagrus guttatus]KAK3547255.1 hypothetical protein QTP86_017804 [Hemibagrus guttatus]